MKFVGNRSFILIKPKKPFVKWVNGYNKNKIPEDQIISSRTLYMVNDIEDDSPSEIENLMKINYEDIFTHELWSWNTDEDYFPSNISFEIFKEWFDYEFIEMCFDTLHGKIILE